MADILELYGLDTWFERAQVRNIDINDRGDVHAIYRHIENYVGHGQPEAESFHLKYHWSIICGWVMDIKQEEEEIG